MQLTSLLPAFLLSTLAFASTSQVALQDDSKLDVPGSNPLKFCEDPSNYLLDIDNVDLDPNPPKAGQALAIAANGTLREAVQEGAKVHLQVKYGLIKLINQEADLCDYVDKVELSCPLKEGDQKLVKSVDLPQQIPPGKYTVLADVYNPDKSKITCLTAMVEFKREGNGPW
ncbi:MAG: hypothetical protein Q9159_002520 [Coniocarpon cinnabarinum]